MEGSRFSQYRIMWVLLFFDLPTATKTDTKNYRKFVKHLEADGKDIPPLIKHYMKMGGTFSSFSIDEEFGGTLDGLILVDLPNSPIKSLKNYLGDNYPEYTKRHLD